MPESSASKPSETGDVWST